MELIQRSWAKQLTEMCALIMMIIRHAIGQAKYKFAIVANFIFTIYPMLLLVSLGTVPNEYQ